MIMSTQKLPDMKTNFSEWYHEVVFQAELADQAPVRGCIIMRPYGYAIWENIQKILDKKIKDTGHQNAAFPLLIPQSFLTKEAEHIKGFSPELAVVTHAGGKELEEPLVVRPTSETIIHYMFARWLTSWRDLPFKINQWASVVRWEMRTRPFLRTTEFWWQEGHTAHETAQEAEDEARLMLAEYRDLIENFLAIPVVAGEKPESERFAGADETFTMEGLMQDGRALQMGTSHIISQNFAKSFNMVFQDRNGAMAYPHLTSWAVTTRLIGALIMVHGDQSGLVLPPAIAPIQIVIIPIIKQDTKEKVFKYVHNIVAALPQEIRVHIDADEHTTPGAKFYKWELKGVPLRLEIGHRDVDNQQAVLFNRLDRTKTNHTVGELASVIQKSLERIHKGLFTKALRHRTEQWHKQEKLSNFSKKLSEEGGFFQTGWCGKNECELFLKEEKASIRCLLQEKSLATCFNCDSASHGDILVAKSY
jgi:prolyl-tRNA synthetase